jgi:Zyg-11 family protein
MYPENLVNQRAPESLLDLCFKFVVNHLETICTIDPFTKDYKLQEGLTLPSELCERILQVYQQMGNSVDDRFINIFQNYEATPLKRVRLRNSSITDDGLCTLLNHNLVELDLSYCENLTEGSLVHINEVGHHLLSLSIGGFVQVLPDSLYPEKSAHENMNVVISPYERRGYILRTPNLRRLAVRALYVPGERFYFPILLRPLKNLTHLDLSSCEDLGTLDYLTEMANLMSLVLYNVHRIQDMLPAICSLKTLRFVNFTFFFVLQSCSSHCC